MDVTPQILDIHRIYGSSDNTAPAQLSSSRALNYANGASIQKPEQSRVTKIPFTFNYVDAVGLFGVENHFVKINLAVIDTGLDNVVINSYEDADMTIESTAVVNTYETGYFNEDEDNITINTYEPALVTFDVLPKYIKAKLSVELINNKTGNQYIDRDLDVRLYTKDRQEWDYDKMYLDLTDSFYVGFHARNTRRLPYNVTCRIGFEYLDFYDLSPAQKRLTPNLQ